MQDTEDNTQQRSTPDLAELGHLCGCTPKQVKFAEGMLQGMNQTEAALHAGYAGEAGSVALRSAGSSAARANPVQALLALAQSKGLGVPDAPGDMDELKRILWTIARSKNKQNSISATKELMELEAKEKAAHEEPISPQEALAELAAFNPQIAAELATVNNLSLDSIPTEVRGLAAHHVEKVAAGWISNNPQRAIEIARYWLQPSAGTNAHQLINGNGNG